MPKPPLQKLITVPIFILVLLFSLIKPCLSEDLTKYVPNEVKHKDGNREFFYDAKLIKLNTARILSIYIFKNYDRNDFPLIYKIPNSDIFYLVSVYGGGTDEDYGRRFLLLQKRGSRISRLFVGKGMMDSYILKPVFYFNDNRVLILADLGTEYSWGLAAHELHNGKMKSLGLIDVALDNEKPFSNLVSPLQNAKVEYENDTYYLKFSGKLYLHPGSENETPIESKSNSVVFYFDGKEFVQANSSH